MTLATDEILGAAGFRLRVPFAEMTQAELDRLCIISWLGLPVLRAFVEGVQRGIYPVRTDQLSEVRAFASERRVPYPVLAACFGYLYRPQHDLFRHVLDKPLTRTEKARILWQEYPGFVLWSELCGADHITVDVEAEVPTTLSAGPASK